MNVAFDKILFVWRKKSMAFNAYQTIAILSNQSLSLKKLHRLCQSESIGEAVNMSQSVLGKNLWLNNNLLEATLRRHQDDESIFVKTFEVKKAITNRKQSYWCDVVRLGINFTNSSNVSR